MNRPLSPGNASASRRNEVLVVTWDGGGNVPPAVGIATELRRRGHAVRFVGHARQQHSLAAG